MPPDVDVVKRRFSRYELETLWAAEQLAPWGEAAATLRMEYLGQMLVAGSSESFALETRQSAYARATMIVKDLIGQFDEGPKRPNVSAVTGK